MVWTKAAYTIRRNAINRAVRCRVAHQGKVPCIHRCIRSRRGQPPGRLYALVTPKHHSLLGSTAAAAAAAAAALSRRYGRALRLDSRASLPGRFERCRFGIFDGMLGSGRLITVLSGVAESGGRLSGKEQQLWRRRRDLDVRYAVQLPNHVLSGPATAAAGTAISAGDHLVFHGGTPPRNRYELNVVAAVLACYTAAVLQSAVSAAAVLFCVSC